MGRDVRRMTFFWFNTVRPMPSRAVGGISMEMY
jgi:hypothetical protein